MSNLLHDLEIAFRCERCKSITLRDTAQGRIDSYRKHGANLCARCAKSDTVRCTVREEPLTPYNRTQIKQMAYADAMRSRNAFRSLALGLLAIGTAVAAAVVLGRCSG